MKLEGLRSGILMNTVVFLGSDFINHSDGLN